MREKERENTHTHTSSDYGIILFSSRTTTEPEI